MTDILSGMSQVQKDIGQRRPFRSRRQEAVVALLRTTDVIRWLASRVLEVHGITPQQYNVLRILRGAGPEGLPTLEIGGRMIERAPGITRLMDRLEAKGLVRRERCPTDRRQVLCYIAPAGLELLRRLDQPVGEFDEAALAMLSDREVNGLVALLDRVRAAHGAAGI